MNSQFEARDYGYTIISRFEETLRQVIYDFIEIQEGEYLNYIPKGVYVAAKNREYDDDTIYSLLENTDFVHLKEIIIYKDNSSTIINPTLMDSDSFSSIMDSLYVLRCKIAHIRSIFTNTDLNCLIDESLSINNALFEPSEKYQSFVQNVKTDPSGLVVKTPIDFFVDDVSVFNNLPMADYEIEGGFVGRGEDVETLIKMMKSDRFHVITVAGAGGVGKSALVLKTVNEILNRKILSYDFIVWVSAKENKLSYLGIEDIEPTLKSYEELLDTILNVIGFDVGEYENDTNRKEEDINTLFDSCKKVLIIIDNLETISDERIINFIIDYHPNVYFVITSRRGLGQVERRYDLKELKEKDATHLFRVICREKGLDSLQKADESTVSKYVRKVFCYPLAIKWVLGQAAMGKSISTIIDKINEQSSDISKFCFEQVFAELNEHAKSILYALCLENDAVPQGILKYISNLNDDVFEDTIKDLLIVSLILPEQRVNKRNDEINSYYSLLPLTRGYVKAQLDNDRESKAHIQERIITVETTLEEADRAKTQYRFSLSNFGATTEEEKIASMLAQTAYQKHQAGNYEEAVDTFKRAINIAPSFAPIYRNWAIIESMEQHWTDADDLMSKAAKLAPNDTQIWLVWGNMKRKNDRIKEAYEYYERAYKLSPEDNVVLNSYAQAISRMGDYERANELFKKSLELTEGIPSNKHLIINHSSIAENLKKWAETCTNDRDYEGALELLKEARVAIEIVIGIDKSDAKATDIYADIWMMLGKVYEKQKEDEKALDMYRKAVKCTMDCTRMKTYKLHTRSVIKVVDLLLRKDKVKDAEAFFESEEKRIKRMHYASNIEMIRSLRSRIEEAKSKKTGIVIRINRERKYLIIENNNCPGETYLGLFSECKDYIENEIDYINREVVFSSYEMNGKKMAANIVFL